MPSYPYYCHRCADVFDKVMVMRDYDPKRKEQCPNCGYFNTDRHYTPNPHVGEKWKGKNQNGLERVRKKDVR